MAYQIDQSGKIEQTSLDTIIALSNNKKYCVILRRKTKRLLQEEFRLRRKPRMFIFDTFCALLTIILIKAKPTAPVFIDKEYFGNEALIKARILEFINKIGLSNYIPEIEFTLVGKNSPAHHLAAKVGNKTIKPDEVVTLEGISIVLWPQKKTGYSAINRTKGNLTQDWIPGGRKPSRSY
ncbi:MAG: Uncharacterized protein G01um101493_199 [Microgenomates group bacterium Gr01-1014_93]|nr:MAG: Uncharacterized protein G01um101493_199 [Microgenomates group bacterium Gr01-1014_93]